MKRFLVVLVVVFMLIGCTKVTDEEAIESSIEGALSDYFSVEDNYGKPEGDTLTQNGTKGHAYVIWYRELKNLTRDVVVNVSGDSAYVEVDVEHSGILHRYPFDTIPIPDTLIDIPKEFSDEGERYAIFKRIGDQNIHNGWVLTDISNMKIVSKIEPSFKIDSVKITTLDSSNSWIITDPLKLIPRDSVLMLPKGKLWIMSVFTSPSTESVVVFIHTMGNQRFHRYRIRKQSDGIFIGYCWTSPGNGIFRWGVDALTYGTIFEDDSTLYPYKAEAWIIPYVSITE